VAPIDYGFYVERQLQPVADAILAFMGGDFETVMSAQARLF
jgi:DNA polymerase-2